MLFEGGVNISQPFVSNGLRWFRFLSRSLHVRYPQTEFATSANRQWMKVKHVKNQVSVVSASLVSTVLGRSNQVAANIYAVSESRQLEAYGCIESDRVYL